MNNLEKKVKESFRMEMIGTGMYRALASQYREKPDLSSRFREYADQEEMHGRLFREFYRKNFKGEIGNGKFWLFAGRAAAFFMRALTLEAKLKRISAIESGAVRQIEEALSPGEDSGIFKIMRRILPDEKAHAALYRELYHR